ncbi:MAG: hypothetical protein RBU21_17585 [FCB group bacterium]|jgi:hypothetical protein|nr:hypothetical protein [FCB group bacterium]
MNERVQTLVRILRARPVEEYLVALLALLALLTVVQGGRFVAAELQTTALQRSLALIGEPPPPRAEADAKKYESILTKGLLGQPPQEGAGSPDLKVFGIIGNTALMGPSADSVQPFEAGATLPGDEKLVSIGTDAVTVEKSGKQRTLKVFDPANAPPDKPEEPKPGPNGQGGPKPPEGMPPGGMPPGGMPPGMMPQGGMPPGMMPPGMQPQ